MDLIHYLIIANIALTISFLLFIFINRDETMFRQRRIFIILSVVLSLLLPLSGLRIQLPHSETNIIIMQSPDEITSVDQVSQNQSSGWDFTNTITYIYIIISLLIVSNILFQIIRVLRLYFSSEKKEGKIIYLKNDDIRIPFSFFRWVFIPQQIKSDDLNGIIIHETVHAKELHTLDNIILGIACAIMWFNPFIWLMKRSLHLIHEYLADEGTIEQGMETTSYQSLLVNQVAEEHLLVISSGFNNNNLKKRLIMMTKNKGANHNSISGKKMIPLSVLILAVSMLQGFYPVNINAQNSNKQQQSKQQEQDKEKKSKEVIVTGYGKPDPNNNYIVDGVYAKNIDNINPDSIESVNVLKEDNTIIVRTRSYARKSADGKNNGIHIRASGGTNENILFVIDGKEATKDVFEQLSPDQMQSIQVVKDKEQMKIYTEKNFDGVILITTKKDFENKPEKTGSTTIVVRGYGKQDSISPKHVEIRKEGGGNMGNTLFIVDGKEVSREYFEGIYPENIQSVTVINDKDQMKIYTRKDYDGVIVITTKK